MKKLATSTILLTLICMPLYAQPTNEGQTPDSFDPDIEDQSELLPEFPGEIEPSDGLTSQERALARYAYTGDLANVEAMAAKGVPVDFTDQDMRTPLMLAAYGGYTSVVAFLTGEGADIDAQDKGGLTALTYTVKRSFYETAKFLIENGADVNIRNKKNGVTVLMIAAVAGDLQMIQLLLDNGADPAVRTKFGQTAISLAQKKGNTDVVALLEKVPGTGTEG